MQSSPKEDLTLGSRLQQDLKNDLIAGLLVVIPLATTIWLSTIVSRFVLAILTSIPKQLNPFITLNPLLQDLINLALGLTVPLLGILLIGLMARNFVGRWLLEFGEGTLSRIPLAGSVYKTLKQLLETFLRDNSTRFRRVVLVEYPREGLFSVGFVTGLVGPSGSGKTTLLNVIGGLDSPSSGAVTVLSKSLADTSHNERAELRRKNMGFIFQSYNLLPVYTVFENVELPLILNKIDNA